MFCERQWFSLKTTALSYSSIQTTSLRRRIIQGSSFQRKITWRSSLQRKIALQLKRTEWPNIEMEYWREIKAYSGWRCYRNIKWSQWFKLLSNLSGVLSTRFGRGGCSCLTRCTVGGNDDCEILDIQLRLCFVRVLQRKFHSCVFRTNIVLPDIKNMSVSVRVKYF